MSDEVIEKEIQAKGKTAPRVTPADINANIADTEILKHVTKSGQVLRWAILTTLSGYAVVGKPSASVSSENDDQEIGERCAVENSRNEMWPLMGFALKQRLFEGQNTPPAPHSHLPPHQQRVMDEHSDLSSKIVKLEAFVGTELFNQLSEGERLRLREQLVPMESYRRILADRIANF